MDTITLENQIQLLENARQPYINSRFELQRRMRVVVGLIENKILKEEDDPKKPIIDQLVIIDAWIDQWTIQIDELKAQQKAEREKAEETLLTKTKAVAVPAKNGRTVELVHKE